METSKAVPIIISSLALVVSVGALVVSNNGVEVQKQSLAAAEERWQEESASLVLTSSLNIYDTEKEEMSEVPRGSNIAADVTTAPRELYARVDVTNAGRFSGAIEEVGFYKSESERVPVAYVFCTTLPVQEKTQTEDCPMPRKIDVAGSMRLFLVLSPYLKNEFQCNSYLNNGLKFYVKGVNGVVHDVESGTGVSHSSYCPTLAPSAP
ncbi:hypothetical protein [Pseudarthrobacter scleromae]|uniref:hypothetical protein n=1 Tax=Pseudarthrobacter scleromae TaxID=158897 RepID=UPI003CFEF7C9